MIKNRTTQLIFQTVFCTLGLIGFVACLGVFDNVKSLRWDFYTFFTNLSNFLCIGVMLAELIQTARKKQDGYVTVAPMLKFIGIGCILLTFLMFNLLLAGAEGRDPQANWKIGSLAFHVILPILYILDWLLFYERGRVKWFYPFSVLLFPACYAVFIYVHAAILRFDVTIFAPGATEPLIYPYFFLNLEKQGVLGVAKWFFLIFIVLMTVGYIFFGIDRLLKKKRDC